MFGILCAVALMLGVSGNANAMGVLRSDADGSSDVVGEMAFSAGYVVVSVMSGGMSVYFSYDDSESLERITDWVKIPSGRDRAEFGYGATSYSVCTNWRVDCVRNYRVGQWKVMTDWGETYYVPGL